MHYDFLALGDSYTIGEGVDLAEGWPAQLVELLAEDALHFNPPNIIAQTGWTTDDLLTALDTQKPSSRYHLVSLLIGVNNQYQSLDIAAYQQGFEQLLERAIAYADGVAGRVLVLSIPDWGVTPFAQKDESRSPAQIAEEIDAFNKINCSVAYRAGCMYADVTVLTREHKMDTHAWAADGLHPGPLLYTHWARKLQPQLRLRLTA
ncbi:MAG: GDSL-type esterase/lipase family protein [Bacteroidota bacterium]